LVEIVLELGAGIPAFSSNLNDGAFIGTAFIERFVCFVFGLEKVVTILNLFLEERIDLLSAINFNPLKVLVDITDVFALDQSVNHICHIVGEDFVCCEQHFSDRMLIIFILTQTVFDKFDELRTAFWYFT
jgi:hypothetical protein